MFSKSGGHSGFFFWFSDTEKHLPGNLKGFEKMPYKGNIVFFFYPSPLLERRFTLRNSISRILLCNQPNLFCHNTNLLVCFEGNKFQYSYIVVEARKVFSLYFRLYMLYWSYYLYADGRDK